MAVGARWQKADKIGKERSTDKRPDEWGDPGHVVGRGRPDYKHIDVHDHRDHDYVDDNHHRDFDHWDFDYLDLDR